MIAGRLLLVPTLANNHIEAGAGTYPMSELGKEIGDRFSDIRNEVRHKLEDKLLWNRKPISQGQVSEKIADLLNSRLRTSSGDEFNPTIEESHTYNSALRALHAKS